MKTKLFIWLFLSLLILNTVHAEFAPEDTIGWSELYDGNLTSAVFKMYDTTFGGDGSGTDGSWVVTFLFILFQFLLLFKTGSSVLGMITTSLVIATDYVYGYLNVPTLIGVWAYMVILLASILIKFKKP